MAPELPRSFPDRDWFCRPSLEVAPDLLGAILTSVIALQTVRLRITEVEAYDGAHDPGSHAYRGLTPRNASMFGEAGRLYVYRSMGIHWCCNIVCGPVGQATAVLLRAGEVIEGTEHALERRLATGVCASDRELARGPGRLTQALGIKGDDDGADLLGLGPGFSLTLPPEPATDFHTGPRVGVSGEGGRGDLYPWRFWLPGEPTVSTYRPGKPRKKL